jgi:hypothetical protein
VADHARRRHACGKLERHLDRACALGLDLDEAQAVANSAVAA